VIPNNDDDYMYRESLTTSTVNMSIRHIVDLIQSGSLNLDPIYSRPYVWDRGQCSEFIETIFRGMPIPPLYFAEEEFGRWSIIDGKQRLSAVARFVDDEYEVSIYDRDSFYHARMSQLPASMQARFLHAVTFSVVMVSHMRNPELSAEIFVRLNSLGEALAQQDVRNALYAGPIIEMTRELGDEIAQQLPVRRRPTTHEYVLRFLALSGDQHYQSSGMIPEAMDRFARENKYARRSDIEKFSKRFRRALKACLDIWGEAAFCRPMQHSDKKIFALHVYDAQMLAVERVDNEIISLVKREGSRTAELAMDELMRSPEFSRNPLQTSVRATRDRSDLVVNLLMTIAQS